VLGRKFREFHRLKQRVAAWGAAGPRHGNHGRAPARQLDGRVQLWLAAPLEHEARQIGSHIVPMLPEEGSP
jgi:hypothetical protein